MAGRDLMGCAQTGTGKTAAFALPTLHRLSTSVSAAVASKKPAPEPRQNNNGRRRDSFPRADRRPIRSLILAPTRELAAQIGQSFKTYGQFTGLRYTVVYGGVGQGPQVKALQNGVDVLVATPGRLLDLMEQGHINLRNVEILILDEADQMLDMGFIVPLRRIVASVPKNRQTLMFSATMPPEIRKLASEWLTDPTHIQVAAVATPAELVEHSVYFVEQQHKPQLLVHFLQNTALHADDRVRSHEARCRQDREALGSQRHSCRGDSRQQEPKRAATHAGRLQVESAAGAGGHRYRGPRPRCARHFARDQLRAAGSGGDLRSPHRPHGSCRRDGNRHVVLRSPRTRSTATDRTPHAARRSTSSRVTPNTNGKRFATTMRPHERPKSHGQRLAHGHRGLGHQRVARPAQEFAYAANGGSGGNGNSGNGGRPAAKPNQRRRRPAGKRKRSL